MKRRLSDGNQDIEVAAVIPQQSYCIGQTTYSSSSHLSAQRKNFRGHLIRPRPCHKPTASRSLQPGLLVLLVLTPLFLVLHTSATRVTTTATSSLSTQNLNTVAWCCFLLAFALVPSCRPKSQIATMALATASVAAAASSARGAAFRRKSILAPSRGVAWIQSHRQYHRDYLPGQNMPAMKRLRRVEEVHWVPCATRSTVTWWSTRMYSVNGEAREDDDQDRRLFLEDYGSDVDADESDRPFPPSLNSAYEDEGFGAFDYQPDNDYEWQGMELQERFHQQQDIEQQFVSIQAMITPQPQEDHTDDTESDTPTTTSANDAFQSVWTPENTIDADSALKNESSSNPIEGLPTAWSADSSIENKDFNSFLSKASSGYGVTTTVDVLECQLEQLQKEIYQYNQGGKPFNVNSHAQVSRILFGSQGGSTEKSVLEAKAASGNRFADLILQYRSVKQQIARLKRKQDNVQHGRQVNNPSSVARIQTEQGDSRVVVEYAADPLLLVDASSYIFRAYYSMPPIHRGDGMPTGAVLGFCNMLNKLALPKMLLGETPRFVLVFDCHGKTFRHQLYPDYKSHRPEAPVDLIPQFALVREAARAYGMCVVEAPTFEADDVIATLAHKALSEGLDVNIFSGDKDLLQLVTDQGVAPSIHMIDPSSMARYTYQHVVEKWGIPPAQLGDVLALAGDSADNVPGVPGIGPKIAAQLLQEFGTLENLLHNTDRIPQKVRRAKLETFQDQARLSRVLVELRDDVPWNLMTLPAGVERVSDLRMYPMDADRLMEFYDAMGFVEIRRRLENRLALQRRGNSSPLRTSRKPKPRPKTTIPRPDEYEDVPF